MNIYYLIFLTLVGSIVSLSGGFLLIINKKIASKFAKLCAPFAAGALLSAVFFDLLPEALDYSNKPSDKILVWALIGVAAFFLLERQLKWFFHHDIEDSKEEQTLPSMVVIGEALHNAMDGFAIGFSFLASPALGVITTIAVAFHELPHEIGNFGLLLSLGWHRKKVVYANVLSSLATIIAAVLVFYFGKNHEGMVAPALALSAGSLLYIALSDVVPTVHENHPTRKWIDSANILFIAGIVIVYLAVLGSHIIEG